MNSDESLAAFVSIIADLLAFADPESRPALVLCSNGTYAPYPVPDPWEMEGAEQYQREVEQLQCCNDFTSPLVVELLSHRSDLRLVDLSRCPIVDLGQQLRAVEATHLFCIPPERWVLWDESRKDENGHPGVLAITEVDRAALVKCGVPDRLVHYTGKYFTTVLLATTLRSLPRGTQVSMLGAPLHRTSVILAYEEERFLSPLRAAIAEQASEVDVVRIHPHYYPNNHLPDLLRSGEDEGAPGIIRAVRGKGDTRFRFSKIHGNAPLKEEWERLRAAGIPGAIPESAGKDGDVYWLTLPSTHARQPWEPSRFSPERTRFEQSFSEHGQWLPLGAITEQMDCSDDKKFFTDEEPSCSATKVPVIDLEAALSGRWNGLYKKHVWYIGNDDLTEASTKPGDILLPFAFGGALHESLLIVREEHAGCIPDWEAVGLRIKPEWQFARDWILHFLRSEAAAQWLELAEPEEPSEAEHFLRLPIPLPSPANASAYALAVQLEENLRNTLDDLRIERERLLQLGPDGPLWQQIPSFVGRVRVLSQMAASVEDIESRTRAIYPMPIAYAFREYQLETSPSERFSRGLRFVENCAAYLGALCGVRLEAEGQLIGGAFFRKMREYLKTGISFGNWIDLLKSARDQNPLCPLGHDLNQLLASATLLAEFEHVKEIRNHLHHHRLSSEETADMLKRIDEAVRVVLQEIEPTSRYELAVVQKARNDPKTERCSEYTAHIFAGDHPLGRTVTGSSGQRLEPGNLYLRAPSESWMVTSPFLAYSVLPGGNQPEVCVIEHFDRATEALRLRSLVRPGAVVDRSATDHYLEHLRQMST